MSTERFIVYVITFDINLYDCCLIFELKSVLAQRLSIPYVSSRLGPALAGPRRRRISKHLGILTSVPTGWKLELYRTTRSVPGDLRLLQKRREK